MYFEILSSYTAPSEELKSVIEVAKRASRGLPISSGVREALDALETALAEETDRTDGMLRRGCLSEQRLEEAERGAIAALAI